MSFVSRMLAGLRLKSAAEGEYRPGRYYLPISGGFLPDGAPLNAWQSGIDPRPLATHSAMVEACVGAYAQTVAMCPGDHWRRLDNGGRERVTASALTRILRQPNDYQSISDFLLNMTRSLYTTGSAYALVQRNARFEIDKLHPMASRSCRPRLASDGSVFYTLGGNEIAEQRVDLRDPVPARDVLHLRLHNRPGYPLDGETPLRAAALQIAAGDAMLTQQVRFFLNQARPSSLVFETDQPLTMEQTEAFTDRVIEKTAGLNVGKPLVLSNGLKAKGLNVTSEDAQLAEMMKLSNEQVALAFRVPLQILGAGQGTYSSTEQLMQSWIASGLGFALNHIEEAIGNLFGLRGQPDEYVEFNTAALLRSSFKDRIEGMARGVQGGIFAPNEARADFELPAAKFGDEPRVQQQVLPLSHFDKLIEAQTAPPLALPAPEEDAPDDGEAAKALLAMHKGFADAIRR
jgi:HK97 family phage portal protein